MPDLSINNILNSRYNGSFTLLDAIKDPQIYENLEKFYIPKVEKIANSMFIKKDASIAVTDQGPMRIKFIYLNQHGKNITIPEASYIQLPSKCTGFLARLSICRNCYTPENLNLDYFIDISNIKYRFDSMMMNINNTIAVGNILHFENIQMENYPNVIFDEKIKEFILNREKIFRKYFI